MRRLACTLTLIAVLTAGVTLAAQSGTSIVWAVRAEIAAGDFAAGQARIDEYRSARGVTINLTLDPNPLLVTRPLQYPASEIYYFEPLDERVPVFQEPFRLTQTMAITTAREQRAALADVESFTVTGTLDYQACDDRICFHPQSIPVSYTFTLRQLDTERANVAQ